MAEKMSWDEIKRQYPNEWVVVVDFETDGAYPIDAAVIDHGTVKKEVYQRLKSVDEKCGVFYTGEIRRGLVGLYAFDDVDDEDTPGPCP